MNIFCRLLGHTWVHRSDDPKIAWNTTKDMQELARNKYRGRLRETR